MTLPAYVRIVYEHAGIPEAKWEEHYQCDLARPISARPSKLPKRVERVYRAIAGSL